VSTELATGPVVETIVEHSRRADLLVVQHRPGRRGGRLGSTVRAVLTRASVPVAVVPAAEAGIEEPGAGSVTLGIDDPDEAPTLVRAALREAQVRGARLTVLHARPAHPPDDATPDESEHDRWTQRLRDAVAAQATAAGSLVPTERVRITVVHEDAAPALVEESRFAGLLVVGHRRRPRHGRDRIGPVVRDVVRHARCPVLVVPYDGPRPEPQTAR
jgi:nucleotide-binding universal stress UspA family protein